MPCTGRPAPASADGHPGAVVEWREAPGRSVDPGPAPGCHPGPAAVVKRHPALCHHPRLPDHAVLLIVNPIAVAVQVLPAGHAGRHIACADRGIVLALVTRYPAGKAVTLDAGPGKAGGAAAVLPEVGTATRANAQRTVAALKAQFATPAAGLGGIALAIKSEMAGALRQPAALTGQHLNRAKAVAVDLGQPHRHAAGLQVQQHGLLVETRQPQFGVGTQAHGGAADAQFGTAARAGTQAIAGRQGPVAQRLRLARLHPGVAVAIEPAHVAGQGRQAPGQRRHLARQGAGAGQRGAHQENDQAQPGQGPAHQR